ncbi:peptidoglycan editing factor PgeF [Afifella aestuarii]|uniref:peptidoglycan editing factor PgeF n=1 Tax=Afifella aestuarii TaxID=1909496 RepID=UPI000FE2B641|nr:peptidoglycan editing factor PgeF [Afifella aestuarii]
MSPTPIQSDALAFPNIRHAFFTREGGVSEGIYASLNTGLGSSDDRLHILENRARACRHLAVAPELLATPHQIHSSDATVVHEVWAPGEGPRCDALVTDRRGILLGIGTADCGPVLFADAKAGVIGAAHAGWKGAFSGVLEATIDAMAQLGAEQSSIVAVLGPTISGKNYEVGEDFVDRFLSADGENERFFSASERAGHSMFDLPAYILKRLQEAGIEAQNLDLCTYADEDRFFSYRRATHRGETDYGRLLSAIVLA